MADEGFKRKLSAILSADVKGYSRLMEEDESFTVRTLKECRELFSENIRIHGGGIVNAPGDSILAEFPSVISAVQCAVEIQEKMLVKNDALPDSRKMQFRIGINLGDVIESDDAIYGDGVNIAARIEALAEPGGVSISRTVFNHVHKKLKYGFEYQGEHQIKNIADPVRVYKLMSAPEDAGKIIGERNPHQSIGTYIIAAVAVFVLAAGLIWFNSTRTTEIAATSAEKTTLPLPQKPSIAVLPFDNMSDDPQQEYFSDGISEDIITALSKTSKMFVIARNSSFSYKGKTENVQEIGRDLGVRYVLEGSVRKVGEEARITAQLIDAQSGHHLWAEKYDRDMRDIFALQDEITKKIITELQVELTEGEQARIFSKKTEDLELYLKCLEARSLIQQHNIEDNHRGRLLLEESIEIDPQYAPAYRWLGVTYFADVFLGASKSKGDSLNKAIELAKKAISIDNFYGDAYGFLGFLYVLKRQYDEGILLLEKALELDPNGSDNNTYLAMSYLYLDDLEKALNLQKKAIRLNPISPSLDLNILAAIYRSQGDYTEALIWSQKAVKKAPKHTISRVNLCSILVLTGRLEEARLQANKVKELNPKFSVNQLEATLPYKNQEVKRIYIDALRKSGLPD